VVHRGGTYLARGLAGIVAGARLGGAAGTSGAPGHALSTREQEVLRLISEGRRNVEIASLLGLSHHTVMRHRQNIMNKLGVRSVAGLTRFALREQIAAL
jgi:DNA-binding NarL/FixJ family response regulator